MLSSLLISDIVLIDKLHVEWHEGLSVLTGETGAGKSIILDSLSLALGGRGDGGLVRADKESGFVTAVFDVPVNHPVRQILKDSDIGDEGDIILKRVQRADGRTKGSINDQPVSAGLMRQIGLMLVEIHGQHADRALVDTDSHRRLVDAFGGLATTSQKVDFFYLTWRAKQKLLEELKQKVADSENERDYLRSAREELNLLQPEVGEEEQLATRRQAMMHAEKIAGDINDAYETVNGHASPVPTLSSLLRGLERKSEKAPGLLDNVIKVLGDALDNLDGVRVGLEEAIRVTDFDPRELEETEERLFALRGAARKYKVAADDLPDLAVKFMNDLEAIETGEEKLQTLQGEEREAFSDYDEAALDLSERRGQAAGELANQVMTELPALKLGLARFSVVLTSETDKPSAHGYDTVEFHVQTNPGTKPGPIMKVASGGELSRFLLALKVSLADKGSAPTLIFDEIDTGVGGAVAEAIGERLSRLATKVQVLSVTHAPQVAALAGHHFLISKRTQEDASRVATDVVTLDDKARREEIARMLAGQTITDEARAAAEQLMAAGRN